MKKIKIAILDSGVALNHPNIMGIPIGYGIERSQSNKLTLNNNINDSIGHGTAIYDIISKCTQSTEITVFKVLSETLEVDIDLFIQVMELIYSNFSFDIINISISTSVYNAGLEKVCNLIAKRGTIIISAFDNYGALSYPAAFSSVIGVDVDSELASLEKYIFVENSPINIRTYSGPYRIAWTHPSYIIAKGASYACAYITARISNLLSISRPETTKQEILSLLKANADIVLHCNKASSQKMTFSIERAIVFPFNKEIHSLVRQSNNLPFTIEKVADTRFSGKVGASCRTLLPGYNGEDYIIADIDKIDLSHADTLILGHILKYSKICGKQDLRERVLRRADQAGLAVYSFEPLPSNFVYKHDFFSPQITQKSVPQKFGKMCNVDKPVVTVIGTSSSQGKFTLQLELRYQLQKLGYHVRQIGTEPSALLFGMDYVFPSGYQSTVSIDSWDMLELINAQLHELCKRNCDIILTGAQASVLPYNTRNSRFFPFYQQAFLQAVSPDAMILCINPDDNPDFIKRTISAAESLTDGKVIALVCYPMALKPSWRGMVGETECLSDCEYKSFYSHITALFDIPLFLLGKDVADIANEIIRFFSE